VIKIAAAAAATSQNLLVIINSPDREAMLTRRIRPDAI
jgi:hypothetical protein